MSSFIPCSCADSIFTSTGASAVQLVEKISRGEPFRIGGLAGSVVHPHLIRCRTPMDGVPQYISFLSPEALTEMSCMLVPAHPKPGLLRRFSCV